MVLEDKSERENRFFVRIKGTEALKEELEQTFWRDYSYKA